jgi:exosome complex component RRP46
LAIATSKHVFAFSSEGDMLVNESEGGFSLEEWNRAHDAALLVCVGMVEEDSDEDMDGVEVEGTGLGSVAKVAVRDCVVEGRRWKEALK